MAINGCCTECVKPHVSFPVSSIYITYSCYNDHAIDSNRIVTLQLAKVNFTVLNVFLFTFSLSSLQFPTVFTVV